MDTSLVQLIQYKLTFHFSEQIIYTWDSLLELENGWMPENIKKKKNLFLNLAGSESGQS